MILPNGWAEVALTDIAADEHGAITDGPFGSSLKSDHYTAAGIRVIRLGNVGSRKFLADDHVFIDRERFDQLRRHEALAGDLVTAALGEPLGRTSMVPADLGPAIVKADCFRLRVSSAVDRELILYWLNSPEVLRSFIERSQGIGRVRINLGTFRSTLIPLPPAAEQRRIVAKLDGLTARLARARAELGRVPVLARNLRNASLSAARKSTLNYPAQTISQLVSISFDGPFGSNLKSVDYAEKGAQVVRLENIGHLSFLSEKKTFIPLAKYGDLTRHTLARGDVLFASFVDREVRVCRLPENIDWPVINKADCFALRVDKTKCEPDFLVYMLAAPETYDYMKNAVHGATRPRIGLSQLRNFPVHVPNCDDQRRIVEQIKAAFARADRLEAEAARASALIDRLEAAIIAKAFRGEMVPQDPADEPTSGLLDRLRTARAANSRRAATVNKTTSLARNLKNR